MLIGSILVGTIVGYIGGALALAFGYSFLMSLLVVAAIGAPTVVFTALAFSLAPRRHGAGSLPQVRA